MLKAPLSGELIEEMIKVEKGYFMVSGHFVC